MKALARAAAAALLSVGLATAASAGTTLNSGVPDGYMDGFGVPASPFVNTVGQTFSVPATETTLLNFSFVLGIPDSGDGNLLSAPVTAQAHIMAWDPLGGFYGAPSGADVWVSTELSVNMAAIAAGTPQILNFTPGVALDPLGLYVAVLTISSANPANIGEVGLGYVVGGAPFAGDGVYFVDDFGEWYGGNGIYWAFTAEFTGENAVPGPAALGLLVVGLAGMTVVRRRRRRG